MRIINIVDEVSDLNHGIWHAAIVNAYLLRKHGHLVELWYPASDVQIPSEVEGISLPDTNLSTLKSLISKRSLNPATDVIITHGLWRFPSRWGYHLKKLGFRWVYVPQGMLEPWPLKQKWLKKKLYFAMLEKRMARKADLIRAVSQPESVNLRQLFPQSLVEYIPNGVKISNDTTKLESQISVRHYLFLSRLHHKKNVVTLAEAWMQSSLNNKADKQLLIAGPDQGELETLKGVMAKSLNIHYLGTVSGETKKELLQKSDFFVLPSFSEGLPTALLESMAAGLIPIISAGCNLPDVFTRKLGIEVTTDRDSITAGLEKSDKLTLPELNKLRLENSKFIKEYFSVEAITAAQLKLYIGSTPYDLTS